MSMTLFGEVAELTPSEKQESRRAKQKRKAAAAYRHTCEVWKAAVYKFAVEEFLPSHKVFIFEELSLAYEAAAKTRRLPMTVEKRAFAGIQQRLVREGKMISTGETRDRTQGSPSYVYRSLI